MSAMHECPMPVSGERSPFRKLRRAAGGRRSTSCFVVNRPRTAIKVDYFREVDDSGLKDIRSHACFSIDDFSF